MLRFGTPGFPRGSKNVWDALDKLISLGLHGMELEFVRRVFLTEETAEEVKRKKGDLFLTVHAPYFVNLASSEKFQVSLSRIKKAAEIGEKAGAVSLVFHAGYYGGNPSEAHRRILEGLKEIASWEMAIRIRPETMGKKSQWGSLEEVLSACEETGLLPCIDFAHLHARTGTWNSREEFQRILEMVEERIPEALKEGHFHLSGIEYGPKGERRHLPVEQSDLRWRELLEVLCDFGVSGVLISESPNLEEDALLFRRWWDENCLSR